MRIGLLNWRDVRHPKAGGAEEYLFRQALLWTSWGHQVTWCTAGFPGSSHYENVSGIDVYRAGGEYSIYAIMPFLYMRYLRHHDVIIDAENGIPFFSPLYSNKPKVLLMHHVHRDVLLRELPKPMNYIGWFLEAVAMPAVYSRTPFVAVSESTRAEIEKWKYTRHPVEIIHNGVDHRLLRPAVKVARPTVVYLGRVVPYKRVPQLIRAFAGVLESVPDAQLIIAGTGDDLDASRTTAESLGLQDSVRFCGWITDDEKARLLSSSWLFVQPSSIEGWGISVIEAAACGTPAIAMDVPGLRDAIVSGTSGLLVNSWEEFTSAIIDVLKDSKMRSRMANNATQRSELFSWESSARAMESFLEVILHK